MSTYAVVLTPRTGRQVTLAEPYATRDAAVAAAESFADRADIVGLEVYNVLDGLPLRIFERNLWEERARTAADLERDTLIDLHDAMDAGLPVDAWDGQPW